MGQAATSSDGWPEPNMACRSRLNSRTASISCWQGCIQRLPSYPTPADLKCFVCFSAKYRRRVDAFQAVLRGDYSLQRGPVGDGGGGGGGGSGVAVTTSLLPIYHPSAGAGAAAMSSNNGSCRHVFGGFRNFPRRFRFLDRLGSGTVPGGSVLVAGIQRPQNSKHIKLEEIENLRRHEVPRKTDTTAT